MPKQIIAKSDWFLSTGDKVFLGAAATAVIAGGIADGIKGAFIAAGISLGGRLFAYGCSRYDADGRSGYGNRMRGALFSVIILVPSMMAAVSSDTIFGPSAIQETFDHPAIAQKQATDAAITWVVQGDTKIVDGKPTATAAVDVHEWAPFGLTGAKTGEIAVTAQEQGADRLCKIIQITQTGYEPYSIAVRPPFDNRSGYASCTPPSPGDDD